MDTALPPPDIQPVIQPVILAGGTGSRLWPLSTPLAPKPLHALDDPALSQLQVTALRTAPVYGFRPPVVVCHRTRAPSIHAQLAQIGMTPAAIACEPSGKGTAPAVVLGALLARAGGARYALVLPSDHAIDDTNAFHAAIAQAVTASHNGQACVALGVPALYGHAGYGHMCVADDGTITRFVEKPAPDVAQDLLRLSACLWNTGICLLPVDAFLSAIDPALQAAVTDAFANGGADDVFFHPCATRYAALPDHSIDRAFFEKTSAARAVTARFGWRDLGDWRAMHDAARKDASGNVNIGANTLERVKNCYIRSDGARIDATDIEDRIIVANREAVLIIERTHAQNVRALAGLAPPPDAPAQHILPGGVAVLLPRAANTHTQFQFDVGAHGRVRIRYEAAS